MLSHVSQISVKKRILLHMLNCKIAKREHEVPVELSHNGIAKAIGSHKSYIFTSIKKLVDKGYISEHTGRVKGRKRKQNYFLLTNEGKGYARKVEKELANQQITLKYPYGKSEMRMLKDVAPFLVREGISPDITKMDIYKNISKDGTFDVEQFKKLKKVQFVDCTTDAPRVMHFFGRKKEMGLLGKWVEDKEGHNIIFIHGIAGIGKTTLAVKLLENYRGSKHLYWHNFHSMDTLRGAIFKLSVFLSGLGHDHLEMYLRARTHTSVDYYEVSRILGKSIGEIKAVLVFDDFHKCNDEIRSFFVYILRMLTSSSKTKMLILSREIVPFYDIRDVFSREIVAEMELEGLDFESSKRMLKEKGIDKSQFKKIYGLTTGNPLFLEIIESRDHIERYIHDELFSKLGREERKILGLISVYRFPAPMDSLALNDDFDFENLYVLTDKSIVKKDAHDRYFLHDLINNFFYSRLPPAKRRKHHLTAAQWYEDRDKSIDLIEAIYHYLEGRRDKKACQLAIQSSAFILDEGYAAELLAILERFDEKNVETELWPEILILKGKACYIGGEWKQALLYFTQSSDMASVIGDHELKVKAICESGHILEEQNQFDKALDYFKMGLDISNNADYSLGMGEAYRGIGRVHWRKSEHKEAIQSYEKCLEISERIDNFELLASTFIDLGNVYDEMYETEKAIECYNRSIDILKITKNTYETARAYGNLAITYRHMDDFEKAIEYLEKQLGIAESLRNLKVKGYGYAGISYCYAKINDLVKAKDYARKAENIVSKIDNENIMYEVNKTYALIYKHEKKWGEAVRCFKKSIEQLEKFDALYQLSDLNFELGLLYEEMGDADNAKKHFEIATNLYKELGHGKTKFIRDKLLKYQ